MGCNQSSRNPVIFSVVSKPESKAIIQAETINTMSATNIISLLPSLKTMPNKDRPCLRIKLVKPFSSFLIDDIPGSEKTCQKMYKIRKYWLFFTALQNNFDTLVHSVCLNNYTIREGMKIFVVFAVSRSDISSLSFSNSPPFIDWSKKDSSINKSWKELISFLVDIEQKNIVKKFESYEAALDDFILMNDRKKAWYARKAVKLLRDFINSVRFTMEKILEFVKEVEKNKPKILLWANEVNMAGAITTSQIVHLLANRV